MKQKIVRILKKWNLAFLMQKRMYSNWGACYTAICNFQQNWDNQKKNVCNQTISAVYVYAHPIPF